MGRSRTKGMNYLYNNFVASCFFGKKFDSFVGAVYDRASFVSVRRHLRRRTDTKKRSLKKCRGGFPMRTKGKPPRLRQLRWLREIFLMTQTPLLAVMQGGESR